MPPRLRSLRIARGEVPCQWSRSRQDGTPFARQFSSSPAHQIRIPTRQSKARRTMWAWINGPGSSLKYPINGSTNYLGAYDRDGGLIRQTQARTNVENEEIEQDDAGKSQDNEKKDENAASADGGQTAEANENNNQKNDKKENGLPPETQEDLRPFPMNPYFQSQAVLSEELRTEIYRLHLQEEKTVREISIMHSVEMSRVAAVIRLKTIEQDWIRQGKPLARQYNEAIMNMLPRTTFNPSNNRNPRHESINDLPVHPATKMQIFYPTSESRHFTRVDAGHVFGPKLLPSDARIPHPEMIETIKDRMAGMRPAEQRQKQAARIQEMEQKRKDKQEAERQRVEARTQNIKGVRWDFKFEDVSNNNVGKGGRGSGGVGWRYGFPHEDRKRAQVKIPTHVD